MKRAVCFLSVLTVIVLNTAGSVVAQAPSDEDYMATMKTIGSSMGVIRKNMEGDAGMAAKAAMSLQGPLEATLAYWQDAGAEDAITDAKMALTAAGSLAKALQSGDGDAAGAALKSLGGTCGSCHKQHREQLPDKTYRIVR